MSPALSPSTFPVGNGNNNFSNVGGAVAGQPVVMTLYDLAPWNILRTVFQRHGSQPSFRMIVKAMGGPFTRGVGAPTTGHYEQDWNHSLVSVGSIVTASAGAGNSMIIALAAGDMYDPSVQVGGVARQASYPQPNQTLQLPDGNMAIITAKNVTTNPHRLTLKPVNSAVDLDLSVTAGSKYFISSNAWSEASALPYGHLSRIYKYTNTFQIVKAAFASSGSALTLDLFPQVLDDDGNLWLSLKMDAVEDFERACSGALLWGQQINNLTNTDNALGYDVSVTGTEGMIPFILANGYIDTYTPGSYTLDELYQVARYFVQERSGTTQILSWDGYDLYVEREQALSQYFNYTLAPKMISTFSDSGAGWWSRS